MSSIVGPPSGGVTTPPTSTPSVEVDDMRGAARLMRERAAATDVPPFGAVHWYASTTFERDGFSAEDAAHIAGWTPALALVLAEWIDLHAGDLASAGGHLPSCDSPGDVQHALAAARAYLRLPPAGGGDRG